LERIVVWRAVLSGLLVGPLALASTLRAQTAAADPPYTLPRTEVRRLHSDSVGLAYQLYVSLPRDYAASQRRYPLLVTLDADYAFPLAHAVVEHFVDRGDLPPMIVVSIAHAGARDDLQEYRRHRTRDYTPTHTLRGGYGPAMQRYSGGGANFRAFIAAELFPFLEAAYRLQPGDRTLVGHSYGGLFGTYVLLTRPELFSGYVLVSPSLWYDGKLAFRLERTYAAGHDRLAARVFLAVGAHENPPATRLAMVDDLAELERRLRARGYRELAHRSHVFPDETHNSVFTAALTRGLLYVLGRSGP
jgi:predicted alpha/beta superfamily hydrolase